MLLDNKNETMKLNMSIFEELIRFGCKIISYQFSKQSERKSKIKPNEAIEFLMKIHKNENNKSSRKEKKKN